MYVVIPFDGKENNVGEDNAATACARIVPQKVLFENGEEPAAHCSRLWHACSINGSKISCK